MTTSWKSDFHGNIPLVFGISFPLPSANPMNEKILIAIVIAVAVIAVVLILRRSLKGGKLKVSRQGLDASVEADRPVAKTRADASGATFGSENELTVKGDTEATMREMKAGDRNKFNIGDSSQG